LLVRRRGLAAGPGGPGVVAVAASRLPPMSPARFWAFSSQSFRAANGASGPGSKSLRASGRVLSALATWPSKNARSWSRSALRVSRSAIAASRSPSRFVASSWNSPRWAAASSSALRFSVACLSRMPCSRLASFSAASRAVRSVSSARLPASPRAASVGVVPLPESLGEAAAVVARVVSTVSVVSLVSAIAAVLLAGIAPGEGEGSDTHKKTAPRSGGGRRGGDLPIRGRDSCECGPILNCATLS